MPHVIVEYTNDLQPNTAFEGLFAQIHQVLAEVAGISIGNCKSRVVVHEAFLVGDGASKEGFVHAEVSFLEGRTSEVKQEIGQRVVKVLRNGFEPASSAPPLQVTVEIRDIRRAEYFKIPEGTL